MKYIIRYTLLTTLAVIAWTNTATADDVVVSNASFDAQGKLTVKIVNPGIEGCYLTVYGGLDRSNLGTAIVGIQTSTANVERNRATIHTRRKYYCRKRTLYIEVQRLCLDDLSLTSTSTIKKVSVPGGNIRR